MLHDVLHLQVYPDNLAPPQQILIDASNGASDYGNKFGEPLIAGYTRTFGQRLPNGERREWLKPIMFRWVLGLIVFKGVKVYWLVLAEWTDGTAGCRQVILLAAARHMC
jgi:phosphoribosylformylglycinamidine (FGAM) synthase-like enzyme